MRAAKGDARNAFSAASGRDAASAAVRRLSESSLSRSAAALAVEKSTHCRNACTALPRSVPVRPVSSRKAGRRGESCRRGSSSVSPPRRSTRTRAVTPCLSGWRGSAGGCQNMRRVTASGAGACIARSEKSASRPFPSSAGEESAAKPRRPVDQFALSNATGATQSSRQFAAQGTGAIPDCHSSACACFAVPTTKSRFSARVSAT